MLEPKGKNMDTQKKLVPGPLLDQKGCLNEYGYAFSLVKDYRRNDIRGHKTRIKEWDYYYVGDDAYGVALTVADNSYMSLASVSILDFKNRRYWTKSYMGAFTFGSLALPSSSMDGDVVFKGNKFSMKFINKKGHRHLICSMNNVATKNNFQCDIELETTSPNSIVIVTPFKNKRHFYYNQKINLLKVRGAFSFGPIKHQFTSQSYGVLDWGRGVWPYSNTWYWASMSGEYQKHRIGFNLGYGFGLNDLATENVLFVDDKVYKLNDVNFLIPQTEKGKDNFMSEWKIVSKSGDIDLIFQPILNRHDAMNALVLSSNQNQVFGYFSGTIVANGKKYSFENMLGFAEKVKNRW